MSGRFSGSAEVDRPIAEVYTFLADGTNDPTFSPRVQSIHKEPEGPSAVGTVFVSQVKDAGMKTARRFELTEMVEPTKIRWTERSKNLVTAEGGYDLQDLGDGRTRVTIFNTLEGHGFGKLLAGFAVKAAQRDADAFVQRIKAAVEAG